MWWVDKEGWDGGRIRYCRSKKIDIGRAYTAATTRQVGKCGYAVGIQWRQEKKRTSKEDLATNIPGRFTGGASQLEWYSQSGQWKSRRPMLQHEWEDLCLSLSEQLSLSKPLLVGIKLRINYPHLFITWTVSQLFSVVSKLNFYENSAHSCLLWRHTVYLNNCLSTSAWIIISVYLLLCFKYFIAV